MTGRSPSSVPLRTVGGIFYRTVRAGQEHAVLAPPGAASAGRYHRPGQPALYLTREADWAVIAVGRYMAEDGIARVVVPLALDRACVFDQHDAAACAALGIDRDASNLGWRIALEQGREPPSWAAADAARAAGADGVIDRSRGIVGGWHVALFRWNRPGAPQVRVTGAPVPADYRAARARWPSPEGWMAPSFE